MSSPNPDVVPVVGVDPAPKPVRRTFTAEYRNQMLDEYAAAPHGQKSALLRREGLYQSQLREWELARDYKAIPTHRRKPATSAAADTGSGRPVQDADRVVRRENDRLSRKNARLGMQLRQTEAALEIMGKLHVLLDSISKSTDTTPPSRPL
jgi:transposase